MSEVALSTGCFTGHAERMPSAPLDAVELASHDVEELPRVLASLRRQRARIVGVHAPCPSRGFAPDLAADGPRWHRTRAAVLEAVALATELGASYVVVHAFYCLGTDLPADDVERADVLRSLAPSPGSMAEYVESRPYAAAKARARRNLSALVAELPPEGPTLLLENLNPRVGYGGVRVEDLCELAAGLDGAVGICLDVGHLALAAAALGHRAEDEVLRAAELVRVVHVHQNFGGRYYADRPWHESRAHAGLQEVDVHLPLLTRYKRNGQAGAGVAADNAAFAHLSPQPAAYANGGEAAPVEGSVTGDLLALVDGAALRVLELDSRYAPLDEIVAEYEAARSGRHPVLSR